MVVLDVIAGADNVLNKDHNVTGSFELPCTVSAGFSADDVAAKLQEAGLDSGSAAIVPATMTPSLAYVSQQEDGVYVQLLEGNGFVGAKRLTKPEEAVLGAECLRMIFRQGDDVPTFAVKYD